VLPREMLEQVAVLLDTASILRLAASCHLLRAAAHGACVRLLAARADQCHVMADSLGRVGWVRAQAAAHSSSPGSSCPCFRLLRGSWHYWRKLERRAECVLQPDTNISVGLGCSVSRDRVYTSPCARSLQAMQRVSLECEGPVVEYTELPQYNRFPLQALCHQATLLVKRLRPAPLHRMGEYSIELFHANTGTRVCQLDPTRGLDTRSLGQLEIADIVMADNTIAVHLMFDINQEAELEEDIEEVSLRENETQLWRINTACPQASDLVLDQVVREPLSLKGLLDPGLLSINSEYLVRVGTSPSEHLLQVWPRQGGDISLTPVGVSPSTGDLGRASVRLARLARGTSHLLALGIELGVEHLELGHAYRVLLQVVDLRTHAVMLQHDFGTSNHIDETLKMCWVGPHLILTQRLPSGVAAVYTWQPSLPLLRAPPRLTIGSAHFALEFLHASIDTLTVAIVNFGQERTSIQTWRPRAMEPRVRARQACPNQL